MNRGSDFLGRVVSRTYVRFNEAPIHESGKCVRWTWHSSHMTSASMRPRFMNRGSDVLLAD